MKTKYTTLGGRLLTDKPFFGSRGSVSSKRSVKCDIQIWLRESGYHKCVRFVKFVLHNTDHVFALRVEDKGMGQVHHYTWHMKGGYHYSVLLQEVCVMVTLSMRAFWDARSEKQETVWDDSGCNLTVCRHCLSPIVNDRCECAPIGSKAHYEQAFTTIVDSPL